MPVLQSLIDSVLAHKLKRSELWYSADGRKEGPGPSPQLGEKGGKGAVDKWVLHFELMRVRQGTHWQEGINERKGGQEEGRVLRKREVRGTLAQS